MPRKSKPNSSTKAASEKVTRQLSQDQDLLAPLGAAIAIDHIRNGGHDPNNLDLENVAARLVAIPELGTKITEQFTQLKAGNLTYAESMLYCQALTLQAAFNQWLVKASCSDRPEESERFAHMALRAQDQCRKTLANLAEIKNPKRSTTFVKNYVDKQLNQLVTDQKEITAQKENTIPIA